jgi:hypothetical protein
MFYLAVTQVENKLHRELYPKFPSCQQDSLQNFFYVVPIYAPPRQGWPQLAYVEKPP